MSAHDQKTIVVLRKMIKHARDGLRKIERVGHGEVTIAILTLEEMEMEELKLQHRLEESP